jgi:hypothetical protein
MTDAFAANLKLRLEAANEELEAAPVQAPMPESGAIADASPVQPEPAAKAYSAAPQAAPLDLGNMFWSLLLNRLRRLFGLKEKQRCPTCGK